MNYINNAGKGGNHFYQYIFTVIAVIFGYFIGQIPLYIAIFIKMSNDAGIGTDELNEFAGNPDFSILGIDKNMGFFIILCTFLGALAALYVSIRYIHKRSFLSLFSFEERIDWKRLIWSTLLWFSMLFVVEIILIFLNPDIYIFKPPDYSFIILLAIVILILPFQTAFEELFVRAYIFQSVSYNSKSILIGYILSILVFAFLHGANPEIAKYGIFEMMLYYVFAAIVLGLIVIFDNRIELAIGVHTATNMFGALFVTYKGAAIQTESLYLTTEIDPMLQAFEILILGMVFILIAKWKYKWDFSEIKLKKHNE
jgi:membrane protease YdiL (CAAX protease family)